MTRRRLLFASLLLSTCAVSADDELPIPDIAYEKHVLDNGLTLIVHEDDKAPIVAVNVWYHVGAKNEKQGKTGFAHLYEHLMFKGSEHHDDEYFKPFDRVGATEMNGTTDSDRTNYFQNVPKTALDMALWMESDRMCCMKPVVDQDLLDEERGVVQNEKRQIENEPYGEVFNLIQKNTYPKGHPYDGTVIGEMEDLEAASLEDVHEWFDRHYGPNNAVLVIAGDVDADRVKARVEHYFGGIEPGPPAERYRSWVAKREGTRRQKIQDRVPQARVYKTWNVPERTTETFNHLRLFADVLGNGKNSRLYDTLVYERQIATDVGVYVFGRELGSLVIAYATAQPGGDLAEVERAMDSELQNLLDEGVEPADLERVKTGYFAGFIRGVERVGGFGGKSDVLAESQVFDGSPHGYKHHLRTIRAATAEDVSRAGRAWLSDGAYILEVHPFPELAAGEDSVDRSGIPFPAEQPEVDFPSFQRATLDNGLELIVANRPAVPVVRFALVLDAGYSADKTGRLGTANLTMNMLDEGTEDLDALEIADRLDRLGAALGSGSDLDTGYVTLSALRVNLEDSLDLYADVILEPSFPQQELERLRNQVLAGIRQEMNRPQSMALRLFPRLIYGDDHAYAMPFTGSGTLESVAEITRDDLVDYHRNWFKPNNATMIVVGDTTLDRVRPLVEQRFGDWRPGEVPGKQVDPVSPAAEPVIYVVDRPDSEQSMIMAGHVVPPYGDPDRLALDTANDVLGGSFTARVNMNLREEKHWSYGARSIIAGARGPRPFLVYAPVQTDKTAESMVEIRKELERLVGSEPPTGEEVEKVKDQNTLTLPGRWETQSAVSSSIAQLVRFGLEDDYWDRYPQRVRSLGVDEVGDVAKRHIHPQRSTWVVVGDWSRIRDGVEALDFGEIRRVDASGEPLPD